MLKILNLFREFAEHRGIKDAHMVGGAVRDMLLGRQVKDADLAIKDDAIAISRSFADSIGASFILLDEDFGISRIALGQEFIDICALNGDSINDDLAQRDITINAIAIPLSQLKNEKPESGSEELKKNIIDPFNGYHDLKYGTIRMISEENFVKDPLRLLRVYRFAAMLGFAIEVHTFNAVKSLAHLISRPAVERIAEELRHILAVDDSYAPLRDMEKDGLLPHLFPELKDIEPESWRHPYGYAEHVIRNLPLYFRGRSAPMQDYFASRHRIFGFKLAVLIQDRASAEKIAVRLKLSRKEIEFMQMIYGNRDMMLGIPSAQKDVVIRLMRDFGDDIYALLAYLLATNRICQLSGNPLLSFTREIIATYQDEFLPRRQMLPLITGDDLIAEFRLSPSPLFREILSTVDLFILEGRINSRAEALKAAGELIEQKNRETGL